MFSICIINPGSTSTKVAVYHGAENSRPVEESAQNVKHAPDILEKWKNPIDQLNFRVKAVENFLEEQKIETLDAVVGRGGLVRPVPAGTFAGRICILFNKIEGFAINRLLTRLIVLTFPISGWPQI